MISHRHVSTRIAAFGSSLLTLLAGAGAWGCAQAQQDDRSVAAEQEQGLPPAGYGTLRQDAVSLQLSTPTLRIQVVPLDERVIRLLANDTYTSLHRLVESRREEIEATARRNGVQNPTVFLVTFFALEREARFTPDELNIGSQSRLFRPLGVVPLSPLWNNQQLNQRETATALYVFSDGIQVLDPFIVEYVVVRTEAWEQILRVLDGERASVLARASADRKP